jgi:hypothetical protein
MLAISTGLFEFPKELGIQVIVKAVLDYFEFRLSSRSGSATSTHRDGSAVRTDAQRPREGLSRKGISTDGPPETSSYVWTMGD